MPERYLFGNLKKDDVPIRVIGDIEYRGEYAAGEIRKGAAGKFPDSVFLLFRGQRDKRAYLHVHLASAAKKEKNIYFFNIILIFV